MKSSSFRLRWSQRRVAGVALALVAMLGVDAAGAREGPGGRHFGGGAPRGMAFAGARQAQQQRAMQRQAQQQAAQRPVEAQSSPARNDVPAEAPQERAKPGRLTPDERRALRQQINDAGRDLYRPGRP